MNRYIELQKRQQEEFNAFPMFFAFSREQFEQGLMEKFHLTISEARGQLVSLPSNGYILKKDRKRFIEMSKRHTTEYMEAMRDPEFVYEMFLAELNNHEYICSYEIEDTLSSCHCTLENIENSSVLSEALKRAKRDYLKQYE